jgi:hypothetical protein
VIVDSSAAGANTIGAFTYGADVIPDTYEIEYNGSTWDVKSLLQQEHHSFPTASDATPYAADNSRSIGFTVAETGPSLTEKFVIKVVTLEQDEAIDGGRIYYPEVSGAPATGFLISDNDEKSVDIVSGDLTIGGSISGDVKVRLEYKQEFVQGYDGIADVTEIDFLPAFDPGTSSFNNLLGQNYGLVKLATPGVYALSGVDGDIVQKAGVAYADSRNYQFRYEVPSNVTDEVSVKDYLLTNLGKSDYVKGPCLHSYAYVSDPVRRGRLKLVPTTGMIHGLESKTANDWKHYGKIAAGERAVLPKIVKLVTGDTVINGEIINPVGIQQIKIKGGNFILWGARAPAITPRLRFVQRQELLNHYSVTLWENTGTSIFQINDPEERGPIVSSLYDFFEPEWINRALRGDTLEDAVTIKSDDENNTVLTEDAGQLYVDIGLRLANTIEQLIMRIGEKGVEVVSAP